MSVNESTWKSLYKIGGVSALILIVYSLITMVVVVFIGGLPGTAAEAFDLLERNRIVGLLRLDALTMLIIPFYYPLYLSIYVGIRKSHVAYATLGALLAFAGVTLFLATPSAFSLIHLSNKYAATTTTAQKDQLLAAGEALLASDMWHGTGAMVGGFLMLIAGLILSVVMLKSDNFSRWTAIVGILIYGLELVRSIFMPFIPVTGIIIMAIAGPLYLVWFPLLARDFFRLGRNHL
jgi:hypothetical protein